MLSGWRDLKKLPRCFGSLKSLVHLDLSFCWMVDCVHVALVGLTNLQYLNLEETHLSSLPDDLTKLRYLNLSGLRKHSSNDPRKDQFNPIRLAAETWDILINHMCGITLSDLEHLDLSGNYLLERIPKSICSMTKLHTLDLSGCIRLEAAGHGLY